MGSEKGIRAVQISLGVVETLSETDGARVTEIADSLDIAPSTAHNHLQTLCSEGYVLSDGGIYYPSNQYLRIGEYARRRKPGYEMAQSRVKSLADETGGRTHFVVEEYGRGRYLYTSMGDLAVETFARNGDTFPLHATAGGKSILAELSDGRVEEIVDNHGLGSETAQTITSLDELFEELGEIGERGAAFNFEEHDRGIAAVAAPVREPSGGVLGALTVSGPAKRFTAEVLRNELADTVLAATNELELEILYSD